MHLVLVTPAFIPTVIAATSASPLVIAAPLQTLIVGLVIPIVVGIITKATLSAGVKAIIMIVLDGGTPSSPYHSYPTGQHRSAGSRSTPRSPGSSRPPRRTLVCTGRSSSPRQHQTAGSARTSGSVKPPNPTTS